MVIMNLSCCHACLRTSKPFVGTVPLIFFSRSVLAVQQGKERDWHVAVVGEKAVREEGYGEWGSHDRLD